MCLYTGVCSYQTEFVAWLHEYRYAIQNTKKGHAESAFSDACHTSSGMGLRAIIIHQIMNACSNKHALPKLRAESGCMAHGQTPGWIRPYLIDFMFRGSGGSDFCSLQKKKKSGRAPAHAYEHQIASS